MDKLLEYFQAKVREVWVIYPRPGLAYIYRSLTDLQMIDRDSELTSADVLPDFRVKLSELLPATEEDA